MAGKFGTAYQQFNPQSADYTVVVADDYVPVPAPTVPVPVTLYDPNGKPAAGSQTGGRVRIANLAASKNVVIVATAAGTIVGPGILYPGQAAVFDSDGINQWISTDWPPLFGTQQVTLSTANITGMYATPVSLLPAPGTSRIIRVVSIVGKVVFNSAAFASGGVFIVQYDSTANGAGVNAASGTIAAAIINGSANQIFTLNGAALTGAAATGFLNKALYASNQTGAFTTGDGSVVLTITYQVVTP